MKYTLRKLADLADATLQGKPDGVFRDVYMDHRMVWHTADGLFVALEGNRHDGHAFIGDLYRRGMRAFLVSKQPDLKQFPEAGFVVTNSPVYALQQLAMHHRRQFDFPVVGITGSNGKTMLKEWIFQALNEERRIVRSLKSYNSQLGVPLSVLQMNETHELGLFEAGISKPGEMAHLASIIRPGIGIFTNIGDAHQEHFQDYAEKIREKLRLFRNARTLIVRSDYPEILTQAKSLKNVKLFTWSTSAEIADLQITTQKQGKKVLLRCKTGDAAFDLQLPTTDKASQENSMHLIALLVFWGYGPAFIQQRLEELIPVQMRLEMLEGMNNCTVINDSYNADMNSLEVALNTLEVQQKKQRKTVILSDMLQNTHDEQALYQTIAYRLKAAGISRLIGIGARMYAHKQVFQLSAGETAFYPTTEAYLQHFRPAQFQDEAILIKGARNYKLERIGEALQKKTHQTVLQIDMDAIRHNLRFFKRLLKPQVRMMAMVKAFSYGSGSAEIAGLLQEEQVDYLGVAVADEGVELRSAGISLPIVVMNPQPDSFETMIRHGLEPEIYSLSALQQFEHVLQQAGETAYPVHVKLDTGMHRLGFIEADIPDLLHLLKVSQKIRVASLFSHLAGTDEARHDEFTQTQQQRFERMTQRIMQHLEYPVIRHIVNSAGIERFPQAHYDMVRLGIGLYGIGRKYGNRLKQISTLKTHILQIRSLQAGETVGYGRAGVVHNDTKIGVLPVGYADGFNRLLSNKVGEVLVKGQRVPVIGNVCMDMTMIDLGGIDAREGDEVVLFGPELPITEMAEKLHTIPYEILTSISTRVKRVYIQEYM